MRVRIVCYEDVDKWILGKFALKMQENLLKMGIECDIAKVPDKTADINHHIIYYDFNCIESYNDTLMITHIDDIDKLELVKKQLKVAKAGICMSEQTMLELAKLGSDKNKLCYINPAHDNLVKIRKIIIGLTCRVQDDGRKREYFLDKLANKLDPKYFSIKIMGDSWDSQVNNLRQNGFDVEYYNVFNKEVYYQLISSLDYYLYMGHDEGQMGFVDAVAAGIETIVTPQGYHLDAPNAITHPFNTYEELEDILLNIQEKKKQLVQSVASWNWYDYTLKHVELWRHLLDKNFTKSNFKDGLNSLLFMQQTEFGDDDNFVLKKKQELIKGKSSHRYYMLKRLIKTEGILAFIKLIIKRIFKF